MKFLRSLENEARLASLDDGEQSLRVDEWTFDDWRAGCDIDRVSVCKNDVEGHESAVLDGMRETLSDRVIESFVFELFGTRESDSVGAWLKSYGYEVFRIYKGRTSIHYAADRADRPAASTADIVVVEPNSEAKSKIATLGHDQSG